MSLNQKKKLFKWISIMEGLSFLILLFLAMPLKYIFDYPQMVRSVGMVHGLLFVAYCLGALFLYKPMNWGKKELGIILGCSVIPFGPFYAEKQYI